MSTAFTTAMIEEPTAPNSLDAYWMPFTANRQFKAKPRLLGAAKGMYYTSVDGRQILDAAAGMWCVNAGHGRAEVTEAIQKQAAKMDYAPPFQMGHPLAFELASRVAAMLPGDLDHVFFANSGSEAVDTALKIALAYHNARGDGRRLRLIGRERGYHGVGFGGISVGGMVANRKQFGTVLGTTDHLPHTHHPEHNAFSHGQPRWGTHLADVLEDLVALHGADTIACVIVEPVAGSTGVLIPPVGYLRRLREICDRHGILLIFDEVITGFGRLGASFAAEYFDIVPDMVTMAKALTNAAVPMSAVAVRKGIYDAFMDGPDNMIELFHGYTYSAHPLACAAGLATMEIYREEELFDRAAEMAPYFEGAIHAMKDLPNVIDVRNLGMMGAIELEPRPGAPTTRAVDAFVHSYEHGVLMRTTGDILAFSPPLIVDRGQIDQIFDTVADAVKATA